MFVIGGEKSKRLVCALRKNLKAASIKNRPSLKQKNTKKKPKTQFEGIWVARPDPVCAKTHTTTESYDTSENRDSAIQQRYNAIRQRYSPFFDTWCDSYRWSLILYRIAIHIACIVRYLLPWLQELCGEDDELCVLCSQHLGPLSFL